jgi:sterol desaturase/sphingolipid hydroxylase (fatty acid hydroxylase superfamily)
MAFLAILVLIAVVMFVIELAAPGRKFPDVGGWWARAAFLNAIQISAVVTSSLFWNGLFAKHSLFSLHHLSAPVGAILGYFVITFVFYWWHVARHKSDFLWRWFHQIHHSPKRLEVLTAFYKHPVEIFFNAILSSAILYLLLGLEPQAAGLAVGLTAVGELFYHWNVKTPYWVGFIFQRPESHCVHHQDGIHHYNYSDLPLWDMLFGTFRNPARWDGKCGLGDAELQLGRMLKGETVESSTSAKAH